MPNTGQYKTMLSYDYGRNWNKLDLSDIVASDYFDLKRKKYWLCNIDHSISKLYQKDLP